MPTSQLIQILRSKSSLTDAQIIELTDDDAWKIIYEIDAREKAERDAKRRDTVCFTGFSKADKSRLEKIATDNGLKPVSGVSQSLSYLVIGDTPGESKISKAETAGVKILQAHEFEQLFG